MGATEPLVPPATGMLRFITAGSVDDGKSTLIGRLLYDAKGIFEDQMSAIERASLRRGRAQADLSLLTDGLQAEREQGITIDVAYRYFATPRRKFIIADSPGHEQYTRNMVTAASTAQVAVILLDVRNGILTQTRRHAYLASLLGVRHVIFAINKMDLVGYDRTLFSVLRDRLAEFAANAGIAHAYYVPISALAGDNVVESGGGMPWYEGPALLELLEDIDAQRDLVSLPLRFPVQGVLRATGRKTDRPWVDFRGYAGRIESGSVSVGDRVTVLPSGATTTVRAIHTLDGEPLSAAAPQSVALLLADPLDVSRGDLIVHPDDAPAVSAHLAATVCWLHATPLDPRRKYLLRHGARLVRALVSEVEHRIDINTLNPRSADTLRVNDIGRIRLRLQQPIAFDAYRDNRTTGSFILIDETTNDTVAGGLIDHG
jgi:sulfate adenylyltransferase subunit 1